jgi:hypothetical protein
MLVVNEPTVVPASAQTKFLGPVVVGDRMEAEAAGAPVFEGEVLAVVPDKHILDR